MRMYSFLLVFSFCVVSAPTADAECLKPVQLGSTFNMSQTINTLPDIGFVWQVKGKNSTNFNTVCTCQKTSLTCPGCQSGFQATIQAQGGGYTSVLTRNNVPLDYDQAKVWWIPTTSDGPCKLQVYDYRSTPTCGAPYLENKGNDSSPDFRITMVCSIADVFPRPSCQFKERKDGGNATKIPKTDVQEEEITTTNRTGHDYYDWQCTLSRRVTGLEPGNYTFQVSMSPQNILGVEKSSTWSSNSITLEPPKSAPNLTIQPSTKDGDTGSIINVVNGTSVQVQCNVQGGFPPVTKVKLDCGDQQYNQDSTSTKAVVTLNIDKDKHNGKWCNCSAEHESGCYHLSTEYKFNVLYASKVINYTVTAEKIGTGSPDSSPIQVDLDTKVNFTCEGEGNPRPKVEVLHQSGRRLGQSSSDVGDYGKLSKSTMTMTCKDTAVYRCEVTNTIGELTNSTKKIVVLVNCPPKLETADGEPKTFEPINGTTLTIEFTIYGHPAPNSYKLMKLNDLTRTRRSVDEGQEVVRDRYKVKFEKKDLLYGEVQLQMNNTFSRDNGEYQLDIKNGIGEGLKYIFIVRTKAEEPESEASIVPIIGAVVGAVVLAIIIIAVVVSYRKGYLCFGKKEKISGGYKENKAAKKKKEAVGPRNAKGVEASNRNQPGGDDNEVIIINDMYGKCPGNESPEVMIRNSLYGTNVRRDSEEVVIVNDLYGKCPGNESPEVMIRNSLYGTNVRRDSEEVMIVNSLYGTNVRRDSEEVVIINDLYGKVPGMDRTGSQDDLIDDDNPYEDLEGDGAPTKSAASNKSAAKAPPKPKKPGLSAASKPKSKKATGTEKQIQGKTEQEEEAPEEMYSSVFKDKKSKQEIDNVYSNTEELQLFQPQSQAPAIPEKKFDEKKEKQKRKQKEKAKKGSRENLAMAKKQAGSSYINVALDMGDEDPAHATQV